jgi:hypothetical protein
MEEHEGDLKEELHDLILLEGDEQEKQLDRKLDEIEMELHDEHPEMWLEDLKLEEKLDDVKLLDSEENLELDEGLLMLLEGEL